MAKYSSKRPMTQKRHELIRQKFNDFIAPNEHGLRPDFAVVFKKLSDHFGYSQDYVRTILRN